MAQRLIEVVLPADRSDSLDQLLDELAPDGVWSRFVEYASAHVKLIVDSERSGTVLDALEERFGHDPDFRLVVLPVSASLPRPTPPEPAHDEPDHQTQNGAESESAERATIAINREELWTEISRSSTLSRAFGVMVVLSTLVAGFGMVRDNAPIIIGAMVIAPLLGPNVALAFGTTLGDFALVRQSLLSNLAGFAMALGIAALLGLFFTIDPTLTQIALRSEVHLTDIVIALAAGSAGVLAMTMGYSTAVVGVMVAVALLPPTVAVGLLIGSAHWSDAFQALLLLLINIICVNLAGVVTFVAQGIRPRRWWEADRARKASRAAFVIWLALLIVVTVLIYFADKE